ncbi:thioredoxin family protein [Prochlorococcus sp. MIT 1223]|uniref:thioredoxin family protein n=1 Tax=Prochlorococcus sp. MIT 1223 TaxID=3096217 RepID=UPI002A756CA2|nr:thioredoxin family protein [Prochlorococcus sp. MIT 1223]
MVRTASNMLPLGTRLPAFELPVVEGIELGPFYGKGCRSINQKMFSLKPILFMLICAHCPFVKHVENGLTNLQEDYGEKIYMIAVSSNSLITHPQDAPVYLSKQANTNGWRFPYLFDQDQLLAKSLMAACTPDFFLFAPSLINGEHELQYRGQLDGSRPANGIPVTGKDLRQALDKVLNGEPVNVDQNPSIGCNIKWHPGKEPFWFG